MEQIFIDVLIQELIKAQEAAEAAIGNKRYSGSSCKMVVIPTIFGATPEIYQELATRSGVPYSDWDGRIAFHFARRRGDDERVGVMAAFKHLIYNADDYQWELVYMSSF